jgi:hypothetical protein
MKKKLKLLSLLMIVNGVYAQQTPTNTNPSGAASGLSSQQYWSRAGNNNSNGTNNVFGTLWNSPIYTVTNGINRMKLNGNYTSGTNQYAIDGFTFGATPTTINTSGFLLIGEGASGSNFLNTKGAFSMLHLNGDKASYVQELGYRPWMRTGITFTDNQDLSYFGLRQVGTGFDITETTMTWFDNSSTANGH